MRIATMSMMCLLATAWLARADELTHVCNHGAMNKMAVAPKAISGAAIHAPGTVTFSVTFEEPTGAFSDWNDRAELVVLAAAREWSRFLDGAVNIEIEVRFRDSAGIGGSQVLAAARSDFFTIGGDTTIGILGTILEIVGHPDPNGVLVDAVITINSDALLNDFSFDLDGAVPGRTDLYTVLLHEIGHVLGFNGNTLFGSDGDWKSTFDLNVIFDATGGFFFAGDNTVANFGSGVWLALDNTQHVWSGIPSLMNPGIATGVRLSVGKLEFAMLSDSGMPVNLFCWPEASLFEADFDGDRTPDCVDGCPSNPLLAEAGECGCDSGDRDGDGVMDCLDDCPNNPLLTSLTACGCNAQDTDGDGVMDCLDGCPDNPFMTSLGECGCSVADRDGDGTLDCADGCPDNPDLAAVGVCGCDTSDRDGDGELDCLDGCPDNPLLTDVGECGCNLNDTDGDGVLDCLDQCPDDPSKALEGSCGCGVPETDSDSDGVSDCIDECPDDPDKATSGECGCGVPDGTCTPSGLCGAGLPMAMLVSMLTLSLCMVQRKQK